MADWALNGDWAYNNDWEGVQFTHVLSIAHVSGTSIAGAAARLGDFAVAHASDIATAGTPGRYSVIQVTHASAATAAGAKAALGDMALSHSHDIATTGTSINLTGTIGISIASSVSQEGQKQAQGDVAITENATQEFVYVPTIVITTSPLTYRNNVADGPLSRKVAVGTGGYKK